MLHTLWWWWYLAYLFQAVNQAVLAGPLVPPQLTVKDFYMTGGLLVLLSLKLVWGLFLHQNSPENECYKCPASISLKQSEYWLILDPNGKIKLITDHKKVHKKQTTQLLSGNVLLKQWTENILLPQITFKCHLQNSYASKDGAVSCPEIKNDMTLSSDKASKWFWFYHVMVKDKNAVYSWHL